jgi:hypothetical protein
MPLFILVLGMPGYYMLDKSLSKMTVGIEEQEANTRNFIKNNPERAQECGAEHLLEASNSFRDVISILREGVGQYIVSAFSILFFLSIVREYYVYRKK